MISDLKSLIDPIGEADFLALLRERKLAFLPGCGARRFETLLNWETLNHLLDSGTFPLAALRVMRESVSIPTNIYVRHGRVDAAALSKLLDRGVSLIFNLLDEYAPALRTLCKNIARTTSERVCAAAVITSGRGGAFKCHYDTEDSVILQVAGTKHWKVFNFPVVNPVPGMAERSPPEGLTPIFDQMLQPGDLLFVPAGYWHHCENGPHRSLHVTITILPPNGRDFMEALVSQLSSDDTFRCSLTRHSSPEAIAEYEKALKACLVDSIQAVSLDRFLAERAASRPPEGVQLEWRTDQAHDVQT